MGVGRSRRDGVGRKMAQVALLVSRVEGLEALTDKRRVQKRTRSYPLRPLVNGVPLIHERTDHAREGFGRRLRVRVRLGENLPKDFGDPVITSRSAMREG